MEETRKSSHKVIIDGRDRVSISAVNDVDSFNENGITPGKTFKLEG